MLDRPVINQAKLESFVTRAIGDLTGGYTGVMVSLGSKLGLYRALAGAGPLSAGKSPPAGCAERYVREWLNAQAAGSYLFYHAVSDTYELLPEQAMVLADEDSPVYIPAAWNVPASMWFDEDKALDAFRTGRGVAWGEHDGRLACGVASFYRNGYRASRVGMAAGPRRRGSPARSRHRRGRRRLRPRPLDPADGRAFPNSRFHGFDTHAASIEEARQHASAAGVADRVDFALARAENYPDRRYGLICFFDTLHDLGDPVAAARHAAEVLAPGGTVLLVEPFAQDRVEDNLSPVAQLYYSASTMICVAHAISEGGRARARGAGRAGASCRRVPGQFTHFRRAAETPFNLIFEVRR